MNGLTANEIGRRLIEYVNTRRHKEAKVYTYGKRLSLGKLALLSGISYEQLRCFFEKKDRKLSLDAIDKILYGLDMTVLDLIRPEELAARYDSYSRFSRYHIRRDAASLTASGESPSTENSTMPPQISLDSAPDTE